MKNPIMNRFTIEVNDMRLYANHGVMEQERLVGNEFEVTVHLVLDSDAEFGADDLESTVNYATVCDVIRWVMASPADLLETVCQRLAEALCREFSLVVSGMVRVAKLTPPIAGVQVSSVAVKMEF